MATNDDNGADPFELPPPVSPEVAPQPETNQPRQETGETVPEIMPSQPTATPPPQDPATPAQPPMPPQATSPASNPMTAPGADPVSAGTPPQIADDVDLIEKEWVEKAKQLIDKTKDDPYNQNKEINKFKADYIKKRYNKEVQTSKD